VASATYGAMAVENARLAPLENQALSILSNLSLLIMYSFKEIFLTLQGEGGQSGRVSVFARFAGCNLWSGRERDRATAACNFCDTDFVGTDGKNGGQFKGPKDVVAALDAVWGLADAEQKAVVFTGGEPLLQLDEALIEAVKAAGYYIAVESNGTIAAPQGIDWLCVSPKGKSELVQTCGAELKLVYPQFGIDPQMFISMDFERFYLQPLDNAEKDANTQACIDFCLANPKWRLSVQTHKVIGID
jgi:7-carboxy-7-deazaguanine synthase